MSWFWIIGIVLNVGLTVAAIIWVIRQAKPRADPPQEPAANGGAPQEPEEPGAPS